MANFGVTLDSMKDSQLSAQGAWRDDELQIAIDWAGGELTGMLVRFGIDPVNIESVEGIANRPQDYSWCNLTVSLLAAGYYLQMTAAVADAPQSTQGAARMAQLERIPQILTIYNSSIAAVNAVRSRAVTDPGCPTDQATQDARSYFPNPRYWRTSFRR